MPLPLDPLRPPPLPLQGRSSLLSLPHGTNSWATEKARRTTNFNLTTSVLYRMRIVITGGAGFIGSNLAHYWAQRHPEDHLIVIDGLTYAGRRESLKDLETNPRFAFYHARIEDAVTLETHLRGADLVINLAAESHNDRAISDSLPFVRTNVLGTAVLLESCRKAGVPRFHHVSTDEVYGSLSLEDPNRFTEDSPYRPLGPYSATKAGSDHLVRAWHETYGLRATISNCGNNFGPYQFPEKPIPLAIVRLLRGERVRLNGDGQNVRDWIHVEDHCSAIDLICRKGTPGSTYMVSAEQEVSNKALIHLLLKIMGKGPEVVEYVADRPGHNRRYALDPSKLKTELGWTAKHEFELALETTVRWYEQHASWWEPLLSTVTPATAWAP